MADRQLANKIEEYIEKWALEVRHISPYADYIAW